MTAGTPTRTRSRVRQPPARIVQAYFGVAHLALLTALAGAVTHPELLTEFYYQPRTIALVHLVTLGWITGSILGSLYALGPLAWRVEMPARRLDWFAFGLWTISASGVVVHFWIDEYNGMTWAAGTTLLAILMVGWRVVPRVLTARIPAEHRQPVALAFLNITLAGSWGVALGLQKAGWIAIPGPPLGAVLAHAHLAALGWVLMMVFGAGYRLLPMFLPAPMPAGPSARAPVVVLESAVLLLALGLTLGWSATTRVGALFAAAAVVLFLRQVFLMVRSRLDLPVDMPRPDLAIPTSALAFLYLVAAALVGVGMVLADDPMVSLRLGAVYGVLGLVGFLAQFIVGIAGRLLPLAFWMQEFVRNGYAPLAVPLHRLPDRRLQVLIIVGWALGVPCLVLGVYLVQPEFVRLAAGLLLVGALGDGANRLVVQRRALAGPRDAASDAAPEAS